MIFEKQKTENMTFKPGLYKIKEPIDNCWFFANSLKSFENTKLKVLLI
jgi:hypothetical protein